MQIIVTTKNNPGNKITHQTSESNASWAKDNILPQEIISKGNPIPKKLSVDSVAIADAILLTTINIIADMKLGIKCLLNMYKNFPPIILADNIYSLFLICLTSLLTIFAILIQLTHPITIDIDIGVLSPIIDWIKIINRIDGILNTISIAFIIKLSIALIDIPLMLPYTIPINVDIIVENIPINNDILPPYQMFE